MPSLEELLNSGLGGIIQSGGIPTEDALYNRQAQAERESTFGRGLGISSVTRDALAKARVDASLAAQQAQLSALGQAAGVTQGNANRAQQESQFSRGLSQQKSLANQQLLAGGLSAGVGALGQVAGAAFGPEIRGGLRSAVGLGARPEPISPGGGRETMLAPGAVPNTMGAFTDPTGGGSGGGMPDLVSLGSSSDFSAADFGNFDSSFGGLDLSGLYDQSFNPYQQQDWGWY